MVGIIGALRGDQRLGAGTAGLVDRNQRALGKRILLNDSLHQTGHLVGAAVLVSHDDEIDRLVRLPCHRRARHHHGCAPKNEG